MTTATNLKAAFCIRMTQLTKQGWANFFQYFEGEDQQRTAIEILRTAIWAVDPSILDDEANWIKEYRNKPEAPKSSNPIDCPYQSQNDNISGTGYRECFSSSCAMVCMKYGKIKNDDEYNKVRAQYGDSTDAQAQLRTLRHLGLKAQFITDGTSADLERQIQRGRPTPVGWLHKSSSTHPTGGGHWSVILGSRPDTWILHDPNGEADVLNGGYVNHTKGKYVEYSKKNWTPRWAVEGEGSGWYIDISE